MIRMVQNIVDPVAEEMTFFKQYFKQQLYSDQPILKDITSYLSENEGKQFRPLFILLCAKLHGEVCNSSYIAAAAIEMIHAATLIHDDIVDSSKTRRGRLSVQAKWSPQVAILAGDYLLAKALQITTQNKEYEMLDLVTQSVKEMSEGELLQIEKSNTLDTTEEDYLSIIYKKTASLVAACAATGSFSTNKSKEVVELMKEVGKNIGLVFQIRDDIFDYQNDNIIGKPVGIDIRENKLTLPIIHALHKVDEHKRKQLLANYIECKSNDKLIPDIVDFVKKNGGIEYAEDVMKKYCDNAKHLLNQLPDNEASKSIKLLIDYTAMRKE